MLFVVTLFFQAENGIAQSNELVNGMEKLLSRLDLSKPGLQKVKQSSSNPEKAAEELLNYYKKLIEIKNNLGLTKIVCPKLTLNKIPKLIIANTYTKDTLGRRERIQDIEKLLKNHNIDYRILK